MVPVERGVVGVVILAPAEVIGVVEFCASILELVTRFTPFGDITVGSGTSEPVTEMREE